MISRRAMMQGLASCSLVQALPVAAETNGAPESAQAALRSYLFPLRSTGRTLLLSEAAHHDFFMLGELHGETQIPALLADLWPMLWRGGYRHVAAEVSPWVAGRLNREAPPYPDAMVGLWTQDQAKTIRAPAPAAMQLIWGCDIEELRPDLLIFDLAAINVRNATLRRMTKVVAHGYRRRDSSELLRLAGTAAPVRDRLVGGASEWRSLSDSLTVEALRSDPRNRLAASITRENVMKSLFLGHLSNGGDGKVLLRFGRNHLHRGYDARGVSTLGNFVAELAFSRGRSAVNVGAFALGGRGRLLGQTFDADERADEATFALLATMVSEPAVIDLRPLRPALDRIEPAKRSSLEANLSYWANGYDLLLCYPSVTPLPS